jgi:hypothetical protein
MDGAAESAGRARLLHIAGFMTRAFGILLAAVGTVAACRAGDDKIDADPPAISFFVERDSVGTIRYVGSDSLSDSAFIVRLVPEPDGRSVAVIFADPALGISSGLALLEPELPRVRLVWPDSVGALWWPGEHRLAFQSRTGTPGVRAVVDVHADTLERLETTTDSVPAAATEFPMQSEARARANAYIDSVRGQPAGVPQDGQLRYTVTTLTPATADSVVAFYVTARGGGDDAFNPTWYLLHMPSGRVAPVDSVTGPAGALTADAAAWSGERFIYARGDALYSARVARATNSLQ